MLSVDNLNLKPNAVWIQNPEWVQKNGPVFERIVPQIPKIVPTIRNLNIFVQISNGVRLFEMLAQNVLILNG